MVSGQGGAAAHVDQADPAVDRYAPVVAASRIQVFSGHLISGMVRGRVLVLVLLPPSSSQMALSGSMLAEKLHVQLMMPEVKLKTKSRLSPAARERVWSLKVRPQSELKRTTTLLASAQPVLATVTVVPVRLPSPRQTTALATEVMVRSGKGKGVGAGGLIVGAGAFADGVLRVHGRGDGGEAADIRGGGEGAGPVEGHAGAGARGDGQGAAQVGVVEELGGPALAVVDQDPEIAVDGVAAAVGDRHHHGAGNGAVAAAGGRGRHGHGLQVVDGDGAGIGVVAIVAFTDQVGGIQCAAEIDGGGSAVHGPAAE